MAGHEANEWIAEALRGEDVPANVRDDYDYDHIQSSNSANICPLNGTTSVFYAYYRRDSGERQLYEDNMDAWGRYFNHIDPVKRYVYDKEPGGGTFRYRQWQQQCWVLVRELAVRTNWDNGKLAEKFDQYIRWDGFTMALCAGWWKVEDGDGKGKVYPVCAAGARSWVGPEDEGGGRSTPYDGICASGTKSADFANIVGIRNKCGWELEPNYKILEDKWGIDRWSMFTNAEKDLMKRVALIKPPLNAGDRNDLEEIVGKLAALENIVTHIPIDIFRTNKGVGLLFGKSHGSGSTSMKLGAIIEEDGVDRSEYECEPYANDQPDCYGWLALAPLNRKSDPGGTTDYVIHDNRVEFRGRTNAGDSANHFEPGEGKHFCQSKGSGQDPAAWPDGDRVVNVRGSVAVQVHCPKKSDNWELIYHDGSEPPPEEPPMKKVPGSRYYGRSTKRANELWEMSGHDMDQYKKLLDTDEEYQTALAGLLEKWTESING